MAEPAQKLPEEDQAVTRPNLGVIKGSGEGDGVPSGNLKAAEETRGLYNATGDQQLDSPGGLKAAEGTGDTPEDDDGLYKDSRNSQKRKKFRWTRKKSIATLLVTLTLGGGMFSASIVQGPLELVHISQLLEKYHLSNTEDASDGRVGKLYRYMSKGNSPGETRLTWLESKYNDRLVVQMSDKGFVPDFDSRTGELRGFTIDTSKEQSPYRGQSTENVRAALAANGIPAENRDGKVYSEAKGYRNQNKASKFFVKQLGKSKVSTAVSKRIFKKYGWVTWHPLQKIDKKLNESVADRYKKWKEARDQRIKTGVSGIEVNASGAELDENNDGNKTPLYGESESPDSSKISDTLNEIKSSGKLQVAGGLAAAAGIVCAAKTVGDNVGSIRYAQVVQPMMRLGTDAITVGNQAMSGQDIDATSAGFVARSFTEIEDGKTTSSWNQAKSLRAEQGLEGGKDINPTAKQMISEGRPSWLNWTQGGEVGALCSTAGQVAAGAVSVTIGVLTGGAVSTAGGAVAGALATGPIIDRLSALLSGEAVDVAAAGAEWGNNINFGGRMFGNAMALSSGGTKLTNAQVAALDADRDLEDKQDFESRSFAQRMFNVYDSRSLAAKVIDEAPNPDGMSGVASIAQSAPSFFSKALRSPATLLTQKAKAATVQYDYGFEEIGFTKEDLGSSVVADPYQNAELAAKLLNTNGQGGGPNYIERAQKCFGIEIKKDANGKWGAFPLEDVEQVYSKIYDKTSDYDNNGCIDAGNNDWLRIRFFVFDSGLMDGWACLEGEEDSCATVGADADTGADTATPPELKAEVDGSLQELGQQLLDLESKGKITFVDYSTGEASDRASRSLASQQIKDIADGKEASLSTRCGHSVQKSVGPSKRILQFMADLGGQTNYKINVLFGQCHSGPSSKHYQGEAVDFGCPLNTKLADRVGKKYGVVRNPGEACGGVGNHWHYSVGGG